MPKRTLRGIAWDHDRGYGCLVRSVDAFMSEHPDIEVVWDKRSLRDFGEGPIDELAERYDLIIVDHPFCGHARQTGALVDLRPHMTAAEIDAMVADSVGLSTVSYHFEGGIYGFPTDAAAQVASYRPDLMEEIGAEVPRTHRDVMALARTAREKGKTIATPACPIDSFCLVLTFSANLGFALEPDSDDFIARDALEQSLALVEELVAASDPRSLDWNPIQMYDAMAAGDDIVYCPYAFGYSNYARSDRARPILAADVAGPGVDPKAGALLGGAGAAIMRRCTDIDAAMTYMRWLQRQDVQKGVYFQRGAQPGSRAAWLDAEVNEASNGFFRSTLETLDKAYLRPRWYGFIPFFEEAGKTVNAQLRGRHSRAETMERIARGYEAARQVRMNARQDTA